MNVHHPPGRRWAGRLANAGVIVLVIALAGATFVLSYSGVHEIAIAAGVPKQLARLYPGIFDAVLVVACAAALMLRDARFLTRCYAWFAIVILVAVIGAADAIHAMGVVLPHKPAEGTVAAMPWALVMLGFSLWLTMLRHARAQSSADSRSAGMPVPGQPVPPQVIQQHALQGHTLPGHPLPGNALPGNALPGQQPFPPQQFPALRPPGAQAPGAQAPGIQEHGAQEAGAQEHGARYAQPGLQRPQASAGYPPEASQRVSSDATPPDIPVRTVERTLRVVPSEEPAPVAAGPGSARKDAADFDSSGSDAAAPEIAGSAAVRSDFAGSATAGSGATGSGAAVNDSGVKDADRKGDHETVANAPQADGVAADDMAVSGSRADAGISTEASGTPAPATTDTPTRAYGPTTADAPTTATATATATADGGDAPAGEQGAARGSGTPPGEVAVGKTAAAQPSMPDISGTNQQVVSNISNMPGSPDASGTGTSGTSAAPALSGAESSSAEDKSAAEDGPDRTQAAGDDPTAEGEAPGDAAPPAKTGFRLQRVRSTPVPPHSE